MKKWRSGCIAVVLFVVLFISTISAHADAVQYEMIDLGFVGWAMGINDFGQVVGGDSSGHAYLWENGTKTDLGLGFAYAINNSGQILINKGDEAFLYDNGIMTELPDLGGGATEGFDMNDSGQIIGMSYVTPPTGTIGGRQAFLYENGTMTAFTDSV